MKLLCFSFSDKGNLLGEKLEQLLNTTYEIRHINSKKSDIPIKKIIEDEFNNFDGIIFISATGIAIRYIAKYIKDKKTDPAVLVIDDLGRFVISLLSGHLGGANELASQLADYLKATAVITTATDGRGIEAIDMYSKRKNYAMLDMEAVKDITSLMVNNKTIGIYSSYDEDINYENMIQVEDLKNLPKDIEGLIIVSNRKIDYNCKLPVAILVPKNINLGIGCKRGVETKRVLRAIYDTLEGQGIYRESLKSMGTVEVKKDELGILEAREILKIPLRIFTIEELKTVEDRFEGSEFVRKTIGVSCVSEPSAFLLGDEMIVLKSTHNGITVSVSEGGKDE